MNGSLARRIFGALALGCVLVPALGVLRFDACFESPDLILRWFALPLLGLALSCALAFLRGSGRLALVASLSTWGLLEAGFWAAEAWRASRTEIVIAREYYQPDATLGYAPARGLRTHARKRLDGRTLYDVEYEIDGLGRRVTPLDDREGRERFLLFFGCSFAFGEGVDGAETLPAFVAREARRYVAYNYAFHGYGPHQLLAKLESGSLRDEVSEPEGLLVYVLIGAHVSRAIGSMVVYTSWAHDAPYYALDAAGEPTRHGTFTTGRPWTSLGYALLGGSQVLRFLHLDVPPRITDRHLALTARILGRSAALFREAFGPQRFVVLAYPEHWPSEIAARLQGHLAGEGIEYLDYSALFGPDRADYFLPGDRHPKARAHAAVARRLVADLGLAEAPGVSVATGSSPP
jgi:hypothetical protein